MEIVWMEKQNSDRFSKNLSCAHKMARVMGLYCSSWHSVKAKNGEDNGGERMSANMAVDFLLIKRPHFLNLGLTMDLGCLHANNPRFKRFVLGVVISYS